MSSFQKTALLLFNMRADLIPHRVLNTYVKKTEEELFDEKPTFEYVISSYVRYINYQSVAF